MNGLRISGIEFLTLAALLTFGWAGAREAVGQEAPTEAGKIERVPIEWILRYEQVYGKEGLYIEEPPPEEGDVAAKVRADLLVLTRAARRYLETNPDGTPTVEALQAENLLAEAVAPPEGASYSFDPETRRFTCSLGGRDSPYSLVYGAYSQLVMAEEYRRRAVRGDRRREPVWEAIAEDPKVPEVVRREIRARLQIADATRNERVVRAEQVQDLLAELNQAIELAMAAGLLEPGQELTMQDVAATGLIDQLLALPGEGRYEVSTAGEPPVAVVEGQRIRYNRNYVRTVMLSELQKREAETPEDPIIRALLAKFEPPEEGLSILNELITKVPDLPILRVMRLGYSTRMLAMDLLEEDMKYLVERFPTTPMLMEIDLVTRQGALGADTGFRATLARTTADIRPEVLNLQINALKELLENEEYEEAQRIYDRLIERHPGYEPLVLSPADYLESLNDAEEMEEASE